MADVNLSIGSSNVDKSYDGVKPNQKIHFYCSYNSSGTVTIRCNVSVTSYDFNASKGAGYITIDGSTTTRTTGTYNVEKNSNKDFLTATKSITGAKTFTVSAKMDAYAGGWGPTPSGGRTFSFTVYVPGVIKACGAPTDLWVSSSQAAPSSAITLNWSGASSGQNNSISGYDIQWGYSDGGWDYSKSVSTSSSSSSTSITLPSGEGKYIDFQIKTKGSAGSSYYSGFYREDDVVRTYSRPTMSACSASQSYGTYTITWSAATAGVNNAVSKYEIWYSYKTSSSGSWSTRTHIANVANTARSYTWSGGTVGYYYRFSVVALGTNYSYSATTDTWSAGYKKDYAYTACGAPSNLKSNNTNPTIGQTITLSWTAGTAGTNNSITGYELYYSMDSGSTYTLISSSIGSSTTSYSYTVPRTVGQIRFRIRTKGSAGSSYYSGYNYSSSYQTITIKQANAPTAGTVTASLIDYGSSGNKAFSISWANFAGNTYNPISGYSLYYKTSKTIDDDDFGNLVTINSNLSSSTTSYTYTGGIWNNYYKFVVKAKGQYYGESPEAYSTAVQKVTTASTPPSAFEYKGSGFIEIKGEDYVVPGLKVAVMPIGASNAVSYTIQYREVKNGVASSWKTIASSISLNKYTSFIKVSKDLTDGDYVNFRALSRNTAGDESAYFPSDSELEDYKLTVKTFKKENLLHPRVQIKRAHTDTWARESGDYNGIRIYDGEFAYDTERKELRIGNYLDNTPKRFTELGNLFGLLDIGTGNNFSAMNSAVIGTGNIFKESKGYAILGSNNSNTFYLSSVEGLNVGMTFKFSYTGSTYSAIINSINTNDSSITITGSTAYYYETGEHNRTNGALWIESDQTRGDTIIDSPSGLLVGDNNKNVGLRNLIIGSTNSIDSSSGYTDSSRYAAVNSLLVGNNNKITGNLSCNTILGYGNTVSSGSYKLITGYSNTSSGGSYILISGYNNTSSGSYNLIGYYLTGGGATYGLTVGKYNSTVTDSLFVVGNGTSTSARSNAFYITTSAIQMNKATTISSTLTVSNTSTFNSTTYHYGSVYFKNYSAYFQNSSNNTVGRIYASTLNSNTVFKFESSYTSYFSNPLIVSEGLIVGNGDSSNTSTGSSSDNDYNITAGSLNVCLGRASAVFGQKNTTTDKGWEYIIGYNNVAKDQLQFLIGNDLVASSSSARQVIIGSSNRVVDSSYSVILGGGSSRNAFRTTGTSCYSYAGVSSSGADYAEYFEWDDGNSNNEDRVGYFVTHSEEKIKIAKEDDFIIGVVSGAPAVIGNNPEEWNNRFLKDVFGRQIQKKVYVPDLYIDNKKKIGIDESGNPIFDDGKTLIEPAHYEYQPVLNPDYNEEEGYIERDKRKEWGCVGLVGKLVVIDDGTCKENWFCKCNNEGIATNSFEPTKFRVLKRLDNSHIKVLIL